MVTVMLQGLELPVKSLHRPCQAATHAFQHQMLEVCQPADEAIGQMDEQQCSAKASCQGRKDC